MKNLFAVIIIITIFGCQGRADFSDNFLKAQTVNEESRFKKPPMPQYDFQKVNCPVTFGSSAYEVMQNRAFLSKNGLSPSLDILPQTPNWQIIDVSYAQKKAGIKDDKQKVLYCQVASILILRNNALLSQTSEHEKIAFYTKEYIENGGQSAGLLYYCLIALEGKLGTTEKNNYIRQISLRGHQLVSELKKSLPTKSELESPKADSLLVVGWHKMEDLISNEENYLKKLNAMLD